MAGSSAAVLVLEILAGRLLAPYVGVSLETFTGIIGIVLAGIAAGAWAGGVLADQRDARPLLGLALIAGGALTWMVLPILGLLGRQFGTGLVAIVILSTFALFLPSAVLSAIPPMVAKLRLASLSDTGAVVGGLSAAGTIGALAGTFLTGFVLVSALPTRVTLIGLGAVLVVSGLVLQLGFARTMPSATVAVLLLASGFMGVAVGPPCDHETIYFCANVIVDDDNPSGRSLYLDGIRHAYVDLDDPTNMPIRYIRLFADVADALPPGPLATLHVGGGGFSFPRYLEHDRPGSTALVLEIDQQLVELVEAELGLELSNALQARVGDARLALADINDGSYHLVIGDAFGSQSVPWHLTTREFLTEVDRVMTADGVYVMNVIDGNDFGFARAETATLLEVFAYVSVIEPDGGLPTNGVTNLILVASQSPLPELTVDTADGQLIAADAFAGDADPLRDDWAPVDQLLD